MSVEYHFSGGPITNRLADSPDFDNMFRLFNHLALRELLMSETRQGHKPLIPNRISVTPYCDDEESRVYYIIESSVELDHGRVQVHQALIKPQVIEEGGQTLGILDESGRQIDRLPWYLGVSLLYLSGMFATETAQERQL